MVISKYLEYTRLSGEEKKGEGMLWIQLLLKKVQDSSQAESLE